MSHFVPPITVPFCHSYLFMCRLHTLHSISFLPCTLLRGFPSRQSQAASAFTDTQTMTQLRSCSVNIVRATSCQSICPFALFYLSNSFYGNNQNKACFVFRFLTCSTLILINCYVIYKGVRIWKSTSRKESESDEYLAIFRSM